MNREWINVTGSFRNHKAGLVDYGQNVKTANGKKYNSSVVGNYEY